MGTFSMRRAQAKVNASFPDMGGIVGCAMAHFKAQAVAERGTLPLALILEDDTSLADDFIVRLHRLMQEAPCDWSVISLKSQCPFGECISEHLARVLPDVNIPAERCHHGVNYGFYAMLYKRDELRAVQAPALLTTGSMGSTRSSQNAVDLDCEKVTCEALPDPTKDVRDDDSREWQVPGTSEVTADAYHPEVKADDIPCAKYELTTGCGWTLSWHCPGQDDGSEGAAKSDGSLGYKCCCEYKGWRRVVA